jgi:hypothetical protein
LKSIESQKLAQQDLEVKSGANNPFGIKEILLRNANVIVQAGNGVQQKEPEV